MVHSQLVRRARVGGVLRTCPAQRRSTSAATPNGSQASIGGLVNAGGNVFGQMPRRERAADALLGSTDGGLIFKSLARSLVPVLARAGNGR